MRRRSRILCSGIAATAILLGAAGLATSQDGFYYRVPSAPRSVSPPSPNPDGEPNPQPGAPMTMSASGWPAAPATELDGVSATLNLVGALGPVTWTTTPDPLPNGLTFQSNGTSGTLSGQFVGTGTGVVGIVAREISGARRTASMTLPYAVRPRPPQVAVQTTSTSVEAGSTYAASAIATNGVTGLAWSLRDNPHTWLSIQETTGAVSAIPPDGVTQFSYVAVADDGVNPPVATDPVSVNVTSPTARIAGLPTRARSGTTVYGSLSGSLPGQSWSSSTPGVVLDGETLSFTPPSVSTETLRTVTATKSANGATATATADVSVVPRLVVTNTGTATGLYTGQSSNLAAVVTAGRVGTLSYALFKDDQPAPSALSSCGLTLSATGTLAGPASGQCSVTNGRIRVIDDGGGESRLVDSALTPAFDVAVTQPTASIAAANARSGSAAVPMWASTNLPAGGTWSFTASPALTGFVFSAPTAQTTSLTGTAPSNTGSSPTTYAVTATYSAPNGVSRSATANLTVQPALAFASQPTTKNLVPGTYASFLPPSVQNASTGGTISWRLYKTDGTEVSNDLSTVCGGLSFTQATGSIQGTPSGSCGANLRYRAVDTNASSPLLGGSHDSDAFTIVYQVAAGYAVFTSNGTWTPPKPGMQFRYLVVGGGASGSGSGSLTNQAGGGSGFVLTGTATATEPSYAVVVGKGGAAGYGEWRTGGYSALGSFSANGARNQNGYSGAGNRPNFNEGKAGGSNGAGVSAAGAQVNSTGQGTVSFAMFSGRAITPGAGGAGRTGTSSSANCSASYNGYVSGASGGGGGVVISGVNEVSPATQGLGGSPANQGIGFGAGGGGPSFRWGSSSSGYCTDPFGGAGGAGVVYVEWSAQ